MNDQPRRFATTIPCSAVSGSKVLKLKYAVRSLEVGQEILILGTGLNGGNVTTTIVHIHGTTVRVADAAFTTVNDSLLSRSDAPGSIASYEDVEDDGSPIVKMLTLSNRLILYRDATSFIATYTGNISRPSEFVRGNCGKQIGLYYRNTLVPV